MERARIECRVRGMVQGVGFRPAVYRLASGLGLGGFVKNDELGVLIEAEGPKDDLDLFIRKLGSEAPCASRIDSVETRPVSPLGEMLFRIADTDAVSGEPALPVSPDLGICGDCRSELLDPKDRRYFYPFINCTNCGPRFSIIKAMPYDRPMTTMAGFEMCPECRKEYNNPKDRRFHAQPNACPACGPRLRLIPPDGKEEPGHDSRLTILRCASLFKDGAILAIKAIGGFHLACDARNSEAVAKLRKRKARDEKPFAVMFPDLQSARIYAEITGEVEKMLRSPAAPVVISRRTRLPSGGLAPEVAPGNPFIGVLLPYSPLHELLLNSFGGPLVMTSGNRSDEPVCYGDDDALARLGGIADWHLLNDRPICMRTDDSVVFALQSLPEGGTATCVQDIIVHRRSRGFSPAGFAQNPPFASAILAVGAELKSTFCMASGKEAVVSHHIGDLKHPLAMDSFEEAVGHYSRLFSFEPEYLARDMHPMYMSSKWALEKHAALAAAGRVIAVQHHHAHIAACLAENRWEGPAIGLAMDGSGYGSDASVWGGEILLADLRDFTRIGRLRPLLMPGGDRAVEEIWRLGCACLFEIDPDPGRWGTSSLLGNSPLFFKMLKDRIQCPEASSLGRLFDAVAAICGLRNRTSYEGQAAAELEWAMEGAQLPEKPAYSFAMSTEALIELDWRPVVAAVAEDAAAGRPKAEISLHFHSAVIEALASAASLAAKRSATRAVALSGGCFLNSCLLSGLSRRLESAGLRVLLHKRLPPGDGCVSYGQAMVAEAIIKDR